jgi:hypothetical protein
MSQDPMVTALQGPQSPTMDALFPQGKRALNPLDLMLKGQEMLKDPNRPQYDPTNVDRPMIPGEEGSPFNGILQPWSVLSSHPSQHLLHLAGDVIPFPIDLAIADTRRMANEDFVQEMHRRGPRFVERHNQMWPPAPVVLGPGAAK